VDICT